MPRKTSAPAVIIIKSTTMSGWHSKQHASHQTGSQCTSLSHIKMANHVCSSTAVLHHHYRDGWFSKSIYGLKPSTTFWYTIPQYKADIQFWEPSRKACDAAYSRDRVVLSQICTDWREGPGYMATDVAEQFSEWQSGRALRSLRGEICPRSMAAGIFKFIKVGTGPRDLTFFLPY